MWLKVGLGRPRRLAAVCVILLFGVPLAGCLGAGDPAGDPTADLLEREDPIQFGTEEAVEKDTLRIVGNERIDQLARRSGWTGVGTLTDPYMVYDLRLNGTTLILEEVTRSLHLVDAEITAPPGAPALVLLNVTGAALLSGTLRAEDAPALRAVGSEWIRVESSSLYSTTDAIEAHASTAFDIIDNDLRGGAEGRGAAFVAGGGNHWIQDNRVHPTGTGLFLDRTKAPSLLIENELQAAVGVHVIQSGGPYLEGNDITAGEGIVLEATDAATVVETDLTVTDHGIRLIESHELYAEALQVRGGPGIRAIDSDLTLINDMHYEGSGPAVTLTGGRSAALIDLNVTLPDTTGEAVVAEDTVETLLYESVLIAGERGVVLSGTLDASIIDNTIAAMTEDAVWLANTDGTLVAGNAIEAVVNGTRVSGGTGTQVAENDFLGIFGTAVHLSNVARAEVSFNRFAAVGDAIEATHTPNLVIDHNQIGENSQGGIRLTQARNAHLYGNLLDRVGLTIQGPNEDAGLVLEDNHVQRAGSAGFDLSDISGFRIQGNLLTNHGPGLRLHDARSGVIFDNYFENGRLNVIASGALDDLSWHVARQEGTNIVGGDQIGGNWWHDYAGADSDDDGFGDVPYGVVPYDESAQLVVGHAQSYGVEDELPLADVGVPLTTSGPVPPGLADHRLEQLSQHHPRLAGLLLAHG